MPTVPAPALPDASTHHPSHWQLKKENILVHMENPGLIVLLLLLESRFLALAEMSLMLKSEEGGGRCD